MPYVAAMYVIDYFANTFFINYVELRFGNMMKDTSEHHVSKHLFWLSTTLFTL